MNKEELILALNNCNGDVEICHLEADTLLIKYINDEDIRIAYENVEKWYS